MAIQQNQMQDNLIQLWYEEYNRKGIPSSFKEEPSSPLIKWFPFFKEKISKDDLALDLGCGKGRNSIFLATQGLNVSSIDFVPELIEGLQRQSLEIGLRNRIHTYCQDLTDPWPFISGTFDLVVDTFCYKHLIDKAGKEFYRHELARVMKPKGLYLLTLASIDDGYYGPLLSSSPEPDRRVIIDPATEIPSILYSRTDIENEFSPSFDLVHYECKRRIGPMHGATYQRSTLVFIFSRQ